MSRTKVYIKFAKVLKPHGVKGNVKIAFLPGGFFDISNIKNLTFKIDENYVTYDIKSIKGTLDNPIIEFTNIINIQDAKFLQGREIYIEENTLSGLNYELNIEFIGSEFYISLENGNKAIGTVENISSGQQYDFLIVKTKKGNELMVPFIDEFILEKDKAGKKLVACNKSGIFDNEI